MRRFAFFAASILCAIVSACHQPAASGPTPSGDHPTLAQVYFWRARPGKVDDYTRYIRDVAAPIDEEARRAGAFISVTTYMASDTLVPWTHMRVRSRWSPRVHHRSVERVFAAIVGLEQRVPKPASQ